MVHDSWQLCLKCTDHAKGDVHDKTVESEWTVFKLVPGEIKSSPWQHLQCKAD